MLEWLLSKPRVLAADSEQADFDKWGGGGVVEGSSRWPLGRNRRYFS